jgi:sRNA-binding carbon storage regulator CsrA
MKEIKLKPSKTEEKKAGYLVLRLKPGEGFVLGDTIEIRLSRCADDYRAADVAIKAPKEVLIRRVK